MTILVGILLRVQVGPIYPCPFWAFWEGAALVSVLAEGALVYSQSILQVWWMVQVYICKGYVFLEAMLFLWANQVVVLVFLLLFLSTRLEERFLESC